MLGDLPCLFLSCELVGSIESAAIRRVGTISARLTAVSELDLVRRQQIKSGS